MGVDLRVYATGVTPTQRDIAVEEFRRIVPSDVMRDRYMIDPNEENLFSFPTEESWGGAPDHIMEVKTLLRWPNRSYWPDVSALLRIMRGVLPLESRLYFSPDSMNYPLDDAYLYTAERVERFWGLFLHGDPDSVRMYAPRDL